MTPINQRARSLAKGGPEVGTDELSVADTPRLADRGDGVVDLDAEQIEAQRAGTLLELAGGYVRQALALPDQVEVLQSITANLLFENATLRHQLDRLAERVDRLDGRAGVGQ
jgi:hypothetical protein